MISGVHHIALRVFDIANVARFYTEVLGLQEQRRNHYDDGRLRSIWLQIDGAILMIEEALSPAPSRCGWDLLALRIADRQAALRHLEKLHVPIYARTEHTLYIQDPEGNRIGLSTY